MVSKLKLSENALKVLRKRYLAKDEKGNVIETPEEMFKRVSFAVAKAEEKYGEDVDYWGTKFYDIMAQLKFLPNSPTLINAGRPLGQLSACFVLPVEDSIEGIFNAVKNAAIIHKSGGGTGFSFSRLRPKGALVSTTGGKASGPVSFMKVFNSATEAVKQGGVRRGANMGILRIDHPDILEFIQCKKDNNELTNFNISVAVTDTFMDALANDDYYELIDPQTGKVAGRLKAKEVFNLIAEMAWLNGEPGIVFIDRINRHNPTPALGEIESTNPCSEQPLLPFESCNLGSINLSRFVKTENNGRSFIDFEDLRDVVHKAVRFLDDVIDVNKYPLPEIEEITKKTRKIGLGVMGFADMLIKLRIPYNSDEAVKTARKVMKFINEESKKASIELAAIRGVFPAWDKSIYKGKGIYIRNATTTTIAPTGSISIIAGTSSGIEPIFALAYERHILDNERLIEIHPLLEEELLSRNIFSKELVDKILQHGSLKDINEIPEDMKKIYVTAHETDPEWHIKIQTAFQEHTDNAVSKTVNLPHNATVEDVKKIYLMAYHLGCKGVTVYRDGSRERQVLSKIGTETKKSDGVKTELKEYKITPRPRPIITYGSTEKVKIGCGNLYITVNSDDKGVCEVFTNLGRAGGCPSQSEATSRLVSLALRSGINAEAIIEQLKGIRCHSTIRQTANNKEIKVLSCPDAIGRAIERNIRQNIKEIKQAKNNNGGMNGIEFYERLDEVENEANMREDEIKPMATIKCPECGNLLEHEGGCVVCRLCGYSKCG